MIKLVGENLKQYDLNRQIEIFPTGMVLEVKFLNRSPNSFEVPFTEKDGRVYAEVPSILLKTFGVITVETLEILDDGSQIEQRMTFTVDKAKKPEGYECPKPEILTPNYLKNNSTGELPFGEITVMGDTLTWDGDITGKEYVEIEMEGMITRFVHMSDSVPTLEELQNGIKMGARESFIEFPPSEIPPEAIGEVVFDIESAMSVADYIFIAKNDNADLTDYFGIVLPKKGVYFADIPAIGTGVTSFTINNYSGFEMTAVKTIDPKYIRSNRTYFYAVGGKVYMDAEGTMEATPANVKNAYDNGQVVIKDNDGVERMPTAFDFNLYPNMMIIEVGDTSYGVVLG